MPELLVMTGRKLRMPSNLDGSVLLDVYEKLVREENLRDEQLMAVLKFAILFLRAEDEVVNRFGYRLLLLYTRATGDHEPIHDVARAREIFPIVVAAERLQPGLGRDDSLKALLSAAHRTNFIAVDSEGLETIRTRGQMELRSFNSSVANALIVAPTSYGKSEMLISRAAERLDRKTCIIVPSRALISQTRAALLADNRIRRARVKVITHPDAYVDGEDFLAVMTQERLLRLLTDNPELQLDLILVDEAHNLLQNDDRAIDLSNVILASLHRNPLTSISYYTPFLASETSLQFVTGAPVPASKKVNEHVKAERLISAPLGEPQKLYDQFLNRTIELNSITPSDEIEAIEELAGPRTLVYVNKPRQAQDLALRLSERRQSEPTASARAAMQAIGDLIDPEYSLIKCISAGVVFHHGKVPDVLRGYVERLFREDQSSENRLLVTTSTLLEGVNTPADCLIMMSPSRGLGYLSRASFRNLIGRVGRFSEVFNENRTTLDLLQPPIYLVPSSYAPSNWNVEGYLERVADISKSVEDDVGNPLLEGSGDTDRTRASLEFLENLEPGASGLATARAALTTVGTLCFKNGLHDFDIFENELGIQSRIDARANNVISDESDIVPAICDIFFAGMPSLRDDLARIRDNPSAQRFYSLFLSWRARNEPYKRMVSHFVRYWSQLEDDLVYVGSSWGELTYGPDGFRKLYVRMRGKSRSELVNLAVAKVKEEHDFIDFNLMGYVEVLDQCSLLEPAVYNRVKFGTSDPYLICLLRNGCSPELSRLIAEHYRSHVEVDVARNSVLIASTLSRAMDQNSENDILVYEAEVLADSRSFD